MKKTQTTAEWICDDVDIEQWQCSACKEWFVLIDSTPFDNNYNFCPNCGSKMQKEKGRLCYEQI